MTRNGQSVYELVHVAASNSTEDTSFEQIQFKLLCDIVEQVLLEMPAYESKAILCRVLGLCADLREKT